MMRSKKVPKLLSYLLPTLGEIILAAVFLAVIGQGPGIMNIDGDLGRHITIGNYILESGRIPRADIFSFTKFGDPLTPHEWLAEVAFALANKLAGLDGVVWMSALLIALSVWVVFSNSLEQSGMNLLSLAAAFLAAAVSSLHWLARPHIFTILLSAIWVLELERLRVGKRKNWVLFPVLMVIWTNLHGAFLAGIASWACYMIGIALDRQAAQDVKRSFVFVGAVSIAATLLNPDGIGVWQTGLGFLGNQYLVSHTAEYLPPDFQNPSTWPYLLVLVISMMLFAGSKKPANLAHILLLGGWTAMGLYSARNIPLYAVSVVPVLSGYLAGVMREGQNLPALAGLISFQDQLKTIEDTLRGGFFTLLIVAVAFCALYIGLDLDLQQRGNVFLVEIFPVSAVDWLEAHSPEGNGFNYFPWGGYLLYRLWPQNLVFIDGQTDFYGEELTREYEAVITTVDSWREIMDRYQIQWVLMPAGSRLAQVLSGSADWERSYQDSTAVIYLRR